MESQIRQLKGYNPIIYHALDETILPINPASLRKGVISYDGENHLVNYNDKHVLYSIEDNKIAIYGFLNAPKNFNGRSEEDILEGKVSLFDLDLSLKDREKIKAKVLEDLMKKELLDLNSTGEINMHTAAGIRIYEYLIDYGEIYFSPEDIKEA